MTESPTSNPHTNELAAVVIPIKSFEQAKDRLSEVLTAGQRSHLARATAQLVLESVRGANVFVVCNDNEVAEWATSYGATIVRQTGSGLNAAVAEGIEAASDHARIMIAHSDLPTPHSLGTLLSPTAESDTVTIVPDRHRDGTNVLVIPSNSGFVCHYGARSFAAHVAEAARLGLLVQIVQDADLAHDIDTPDDLLALPGSWLGQHGI